MFNCSILSVAVGVANRMRVVSKPRSPPRIVNGINPIKMVEPVTLTKSSKKTSFKKIWTRKERSGIKFCSDMVKNFEKIYKVFWNKPSHGVSFIIAMTPAFCIHLKTPENIFWHLKHCFFGIKY